MCHIIIIIVICFGGSPEQGTPKCMDSAQLGPYQATQAEGKRKVRGAVCIVDTYKQAFVLGQSISPSQL